MLKYSKNIQTLEATSKVDDHIIMSFKASIDFIHPDDSVLDVKKESETLYRQYRDQASEDRIVFEDDIFNMIDYINNVRNYNNNVVAMENAEIQDDNIEDYTQEGNDYAEC